MLAIVVFALIWLAVQNFGGILAGGATDPNSGLLVILLALLYWPLTGTGHASGRDSRRPSPPRGSDAVAMSSPLVAVLPLRRADAGGGGLLRRRCSSFGADPSARGPDVEISHAFMGVAMAGMFVGEWAFGRSAVWEIIFALLMIWFVVAASSRSSASGSTFPTRSSTRS